MSRYKPVSLRHKSPAARSQATAQTLAALGLRIAAFVCWIGCLILCVAAVRNLIDNSHEGLGLAHWEPAALFLGAVASLIIGWRVWLLKRWACYAAVVALALLCLLDPWRPAHYRDAIVDIGQAIAASLVALVLFVAPLVYAIHVERAKLRAGF